MNELKELIIVINGTNEIEILRFLAKNGFNNANIRVFNELNFAKYLFDRSGKIIYGIIVDGARKQFLYKKLLGKSLNESIEICDSIDSLREIIINNEESEITQKIDKKEFIEKDELLLESYSKYNQLKKNNNYLDRIDILRKALNEIQPQDIEVITFKEFKISPLCKQLIKVVATKHSDILLSDFMRLHNKPIKINKYIKSRGLSNEIDYVLGYIYENNIHLDECSIILPQPENYLDEIYTKSSLNNIPISFGIGYPILYSNPGKLLKLIYNRETVEYYNIDSIQKILFSHSFDLNKLLEKMNIQDVDLKCVSEILGNLKISLNDSRYNIKIDEYRDNLDPNDVFDKVRFASIEPAKFIAGELNKGLIYFLTTYSKIRNDSLIDEVALNKIVSTLNMINEVFSDGYKMEDFVPNILKYKISHESELEGKLYITSLNKAFFNLRKYNFILGLSSKNFPGSPKENYLVLDQDYVKFINQKEAPTSVNKINDRINSLVSLIKLANSLNLNINLSYSYYDSLDLKEINPSSTLFDLYKEEYGNDKSLEEFSKHFENAEFFKYNTHSYNLYGKEYLKGNINKADEIEIKENDEINCFDLKSKFSPSDIETFIECKYKFLLKVLLRIDEEDEDDSFTVFDPRMIGDIAHLMMNYLGEHNDLKLKEFLKLSLDKFDIFLNSRIALNPEIVKKPRREFENMMEKSYQNNPFNNQVITNLSEKKCEYEDTDSGILISGYPDRVEYDPSADKYLIVDFKTGNFEKQKNKDYKKCIQALLYAYVLENSNKLESNKIDHVEYRYLKKGKIINCNYDENAINTIKSILQDMKATLLSGDFEGNAKKEVCNFCKFSSFCKKKGK